MKKIHIIIGGKGGCGKSHASSVMSQFLLSIYNGQIEIFDTDQVNPTLSEYTALNVEHFSLLDDNKNINKRNFDILFERLIISDKKHIVVDTGSNTYMPLLEYAGDINLFRQLEDFDCEVIFHLILAGGDMYETTLSGVENVLSTFKIRSVIWLNEHFGSLRNAQEASIFHDKNPLNSLVIGAMLLQQYDKNTFGEDLKMMSQKRLTMEQVMSDPDFMIMSRMRVKKVYSEYFRRLSALEIFSAVVEE